jgi:CheY-like chemotaxis protein
VATHTVNFLLVDDDDYDVMAVKRAFRKLRLLNPLHVARDGMEALEFLRPPEGQAELPRPLVILLDLNMPRMNGLELLAEIRADPALQPLEIFVLTTSDGERDRKIAAERNVAGYVVKSDNPTADLKRVMSGLTEYWRIIEAKGSKAESL